MQQLIEEWQAANPGITLTYTTFPWGDLSTKLLTANEAERTRRSPTCITSGGPR